MNQTIYQQCKAHGGAGSFCTHCGGPLDAPIVASNDGTAAAPARDPQYLAQPVYAQAHPVLAYTPVPQVPYGNFFVRFFAAVIDNSIAASLAGAAACLVGLVGLLFGLAAGKGDGAGGLVAAIMSMLLFAWPLSLIAFAGYFIKLETGPAQATLGKRLLGLKVVNLQGGSITIGQSLGRFLVKWLISDFFFGIGYLMAAFTEKRQALHDMAGGTLVISAR